MRHRYLVSSPTRVDLAGGTLDLWPLWAFHGPTVTVNISINIMTHAELTERADSAIYLFIEDLGFERKYANLKELLADDHPALILLKIHIEYWKPEHGFELRTRSESPVGGGLGGSSSLSISLIKVFAQWLHRDLSAHAMVTLAGNLEAKVLNTPTGIQDYYPAIEGGLHCIEFTPMGPSWRRLSIPDELFLDHALLVYTGKPHRSGINNWQVLKEAVEQKPSTVEALKNISAIAKKVVQVAEKGRWQELPALLDQEFQERVKLSSVFSSPEIEKLREVARAAGADAVKICGAGGGGCVLVWSPREKRKDVFKACQNAGFQILEKTAPLARVEPVHVQSV